MSRRPNQSEGNQFAHRTQTTFNALKPSESGGPSFPVTAAATQLTHPAYPSYQWPDQQELDQRMQMKARMQDTGSPFGYMVATDRDVDYMINKKNAQELVKFKYFVERTIPRGTPWAKEYFEKIMPGWYQDRLDVINEKIDIVRRYVDISVRGPQSIDDMFLIYQLATGRITLPANFQDLIRPETQSLQPKRYVSGLFSPLRWTEKSKALSDANLVNMANLGIPGIDLKGLATNGWADGAGADMFDDEFDAIVGGGDAVKGGPTSTFAGILGNGTARQSTLQGHLRSDNRRMGTGAAVDNTSTPYTYSNRDAGVYTVAGQTAAIA